MLETALRQPRRAAGMALVAATLLLVLVQVPAAFERVHDAAERNEAFTSDERLLVSAYGLDISREFLLAARRVVPRDATYAVVTGPNAQVSSPLTLTALPAYAQSLLLPRRQSPFFTAETEYVLCYGCPFAEQQRLGPVKVVWKGETPGLVIARRVR